ncbi:hypothetical protein ABBQ32_009338 [Trebouxia sp. C0010 RCD-2024]
MTSRVRTTVQPLTTLRRWFTDNGGWIHPALALGPSPAYGARGVISLEDIPVTQSALGQQVVILLPEALQISAESAKECLSKHLSVSALQALQDQEWLVPTMLASERRNHTSFWRPYLDTLPARPSTGWFMKPQESADTLKRLGSLGQGCKGYLKTERDRHKKSAQKFALQVGKMLRLSTEDLLWGLAMMHSRSYMSYGSAKMYPMIDLCNHEQGAAGVEGVKLPNDERIVRGCVKRHGQPVPLLVGQELFMDYMSKASGQPPCSCFSSYGFIPQEYMDDAG